MMSNPVPVSVTDRLPFITGSVAYGNPTEKSDIDLVVLTNDATRWLLLHYDKGDWDGPISQAPDQVSLRFGRLNLLITTNPKDYDIWRQGTEELKGRAPVTREQAVAHFAKLRGDT